MSAHGLFGTSCITALTVQSTLGVKSWLATGPNLLRETLSTLKQDLPPAGVKIGMLANRDMVAVVAEYLQGLPGSVPVVLDPVIRSSSGTPLLEDEALALFCSDLLPRASWVTPNLAELALLTGLPVRSREEMETAAGQLRARYPDLHVVATGGHLPQPYDLVRGPEIPITWLEGIRIDTRATHGTGCAFSTALLCRLVQGSRGLEAARQAKDFVAQAMLRAEPRGGGKGPMDLLWPMRA